MIPLRTLRPRWIAESGRDEPVGVEMDCPRHPDAHRVELWFDNPPDGHAPSIRSKEGRLCFLASPCDLEELTLLPHAGAAYRPLQIGHWHGWLIEGHLTECRVTGLAW